MRSTLLFGIGCMIAAACAAPDASAQVGSELAARQRPFTFKPQIFFPEGPATDQVPVTPGGSSESPKVVPGEPAISGTMPFTLVVAIRYRSGTGRDTGLCTGTVLSSRFVLTAGHCGCGLRGSYEVVLDEDMKSAQHVVPVADAPILFDSRVCRSPETLAEAFDLALLRLSRHVGYKSPGCDQPLGPPAGGSRADCVLSVSEEADGRDLVPPRPVLYSDFDGWRLRSLLRRGTGLYVVGYGRTQRGLSNARMYGIVPLLTATCEERRFRRFCKPFAEMILADQRSGGAGRVDTCDGDSGGPVFAPHPNGVSLIGVTSRPAPFDHDDAVHHCGGGGIYSLIGTHSVFAWLASHLTADRVPPLSTVRATGSAATP